VDRAIIEGCNSVLARSSETAAEKAVRLAALGCVRYSDREIAQIERDAQKCIQNASTGDTELNRCLAGC
jgi:hypothetical protein